MVYCDSSHILLDTHPCDLAVIPQCYKHLFYSKYSLYVSAYVLRLHQNGAQPPLTQWHHQ